MWGYLHLIRWDYQYMGLSSCLCIVENVLLPSGTQMAQGHQIINGDKYN